jgi:hypothetical protein
MRVAHWCLGSLLWVETLVGGTALQAQTAAQDCEVFPRPATASDPWSRLHPDSVFVAVSPRIRTGQWTAAVDSLHADFRESSRPISDWRKALFLIHLDSLRRELGALTDARTATDSLVARGGVQSGRFRIARRDASETYVLFSTARDSIFFPVNTEPDEVRRELCWRAKALDKILVSFGETDRKRYADTLAAYRSRWDNFAEHGHAQFYWEYLAEEGLRLIFRKRDTHSLLPRRNQLVFLHPTVNVEIAGPANVVDAYDEWERVQSLAVEAVGFVRYDDEWRSYKGASVLLSLAPDEPLRSGVMIHTGGRTNLGLVYRGREEGRTRWGIVATANITQKLLGLPSWAEERRNEMARRLGGLGR